MVKATVPGGKDTWMVSWLPQSRQKLRSPNDVERRRAGSPCTNVKSFSGTVANDNTGAPLPRLQISQWQYPASRGSAVNRYRIAPHAQPPSSIVMLPPQRHNARTIQFVYR